MVPTARLGLRNLLAGADRRLCRRGRLFTEDYAYFSSVSTTWLDHARDYVAAMSDRFAWGGSWSPRLRQTTATFCNMCASAGSLATASSRRKALRRRRGRKGFTLSKRFSARNLRPSWRNGRQADLIVANNVLAHVPDINDFVAGVAILLKPSRVATFEFPYLLNLVRENQFDTIYHEHYSYLSLTAVDRIFRENGLVSHRRRTSADAWRQHQGVCAK